MHIEVASVRSVHTPELLIPTATAIAHPPEQPWMILVGKSSKHEKPVLPGGKIDESDLVSSSLEVCAASCIRRELAEEIGATPRALRFFEVSVDLERDIRIVTAQALKGSIAAQSLGEVSPTLRIIGRHGVPDFVFVAEVDPAEVRASSELKTLEWLDCRTFDENALGAGHGRAVKRYIASIPLRNYP